jgi:hypothetical protein
VIRQVCGVGRRERAETERRDERPARLEDRARGIFVAGERPVRERDGEQLVRPDRGVVARGPVDDVEQAAAVAAHEPRGERRLRTLPERSEALPQLR